MYFRNSSLQFKTLHTQPLWRKAQNAAKNIKENCLNVQQQICETSSLLQKRFSAAAQMERATTSHCHATGRDVASPISDGMALMAQSAASDLLGCPFLFIYCLLNALLACTVSINEVSSTPVSPSGSDLRFRMAVSQTKNHFNKLFWTPLTSSYTTLGFYVDKNAGACRNCKSIAAASHVNERYKIINKQTSV